MIVAIDVKYYDEYAKTVAICFKCWQDAEPFEVIEKKVQEVHEYIPGEFYKRELPCITSILDDIKLDEVELIVVDGYVYLDDSYKLGLGGYLYNHLNKKIPVIGVAKSSYGKPKAVALKLLRGESKKPLFVTSTGIETEKAHQFIQSMHGKFRIPTLFQILDARTKESVQ